MLAFSLKKTFNVFLFVFLIKVLAVDRPAFPVFGKERSVVFGKDRVFKVQYSNDAKEILAWMRKVKQNDIRSLFLIESAKFVNSGLLGVTLTLTMKDGTMTVIKNEIFGSVHVRRYHLLGPGCYISFDGSERFYLLETKDNVTHAYQEEDSRYRLQYALYMDGDRFFQYIPKKQRYLSISEIRKFPLKIKANTNVLVAKGQNPPRRSISLGIYDQGLYHEGIGNIGQSQIHLDHRYLQAWDNDPAVNRIEQDPLDPLAQIYCGSKIWYRDYLIRGRLDGQIYAVREQPRGDFRIQWTCYEGDLRKRLMRKSISIQAFAQLRRDHLHAPKVSAHRPNTMPEIPWHNFRSHENINSRPKERKSFERMRSLGSSSSSSSTTTTLFNQSPKKDSIQTYYNFPINYYDARLDIVGSYREFSRDDVARLFDTSRLPRYAHRGNV